MGFMFCDLHTSLKKPFVGDINSMNLPCLTFVLPIDSTYSGEKAVIPSSSSFSSFVCSFFLFS